jgi:hypothetical protein
MRGVKRLIGLGLVLAAVAGCGKKGPPLTPFIRVPQGIGTVETRRVGDDVFLSFAVPSQNIDMSRPADVRRIDVYAVTTTEPRTPNRLLEGATLVGVVNVTPADPPGTTPLPPAPVAGVLPPASQTLPVQGNTVTVQERLTPDLLVPVPLVARQARQPAVRPPSTPAAPPRLQRTYVAVAFSARGRSGPPSAPAVVSLEPLPEAPSAVSALFAADSVTVSWEPSGGLISFLLDKQLPIELLPVDDEALARRAAAQAPPVAPLGPTRYNVYVSLSADPLQLPVAPAGRPRWQSRPQQALNPQPLEAQLLTDTLQFERERCYEVRAVRGTGADLVEGPPSRTACVKPVDVFPPAPPAGLSAVAAEGAISLIWEASASDDVTGYLVLRGEGADATLLTVTPTPVVETRFVDRAVVAGMKYVYAVVAIDGRIPLPNASEPSARVEETAR